MNKIDKQKATNDIVCRYTTMISDIYDKYSDTDLLAQEALAIVSVVFMASMKAVFKNDLDIFGVLSASLKKAKESYYDENGNLKNKP